MSTQFSEEKVPVASKHGRVFKMTHHQRNAKATLRVCLALVRMAMRKTHTTNANEDVDKQSLLHTLGRNANLSSPSGIHTEAPQKTEDKPITQQSYATTP